MELRPDQLAGASLPIDDFQGIWQGEDHEDWVRRVMVRIAVRPVADVTHEELVEIVRRARMPDNPSDMEAYMAVFDANAPMPDASNLLFYPLDYDLATNTWGGGRQMGEYDPSPEQIVEWTLTARREPKQL